MIGALARASIMRVGKLAPFARILVVGEIAVLAGRHLAKLNATERARLVSLLRKARGRPGSLDEAERTELTELIARVEPQAFLGTAVQRLSPVPVPKRVVEGGARVVGRALRGRS